MSSFKKISIFVFTTFFFSFFYGDELLQAQQILKKSGEYEKKKKAVEVFLKSTEKERVINMINDMLIYNYDNPNFREDDQIAYYDDVIAEQLIKILEREKSPSSFPVLLRIVLYNKRHRDLTVKAAWKAIAAIDWTKE